MADNWSAAMLFCLNTSNFYSSLLPNLNSLFSQAQPGFYLLRDAFHDILQDIYLAWCSQRPWHIPSVTLLEALSVWSGTGNIYTSVSCICKNRAENIWEGGELKRLEIVSLEDLVLTLGSISHMFCVGEFSLLFLHLSPVKTCRGPWGGERFTSPSAFWITKTIPWVSAPIVLWKVKCERKGKRLGFGLECPADRGRIKALFWYIHLSGRVCWWFCGSAVIHEPHRRQIFIHVVIHSVTTCHTKNRSVRLYHSALWRPRDPWETRLIPLRGQGRYKLSQEHIVLPESNRRDQWYQEGIRTSLKGLWLA